MLSRHMTISGYTAFNPIVNGFPDLLLKDVCALLPLVNFVTRRVLTDALGVVPPSHSMIISLVFYFSFNCHFAVYLSLKRTPLDLCRFPLSTIETRS